jgi:catechol 2,3-dioxygenase
MKAERFDHCLFYGRDLDSTMDLFTSVLGFTLSEQLVDGGTRLAAFLSCSMKAHDVAFIRNDNDGALHHASFHLATWEDVLRAADIITQHDIPLDVAPTRHGLTHGQTVYFFDPSGNRNEVFAGGNYTYPDHDPVTWTVGEMGKAIFYHEKKISQRFLTAIT